jgi:hypothetical protein
MIEPFCDLFFSFCIDDSATSRFDREGSVFSKTCHVRAMDDMNMTLETRDPVLELGFSGQI